VDIYLSDFGRERIEEEERLGPTELRRWKQEMEMGQQLEEEEDFSDLAKSAKKVTKFQCCESEFIFFGFGSKFF
jgi:hypothetical protein